LRLLSSAPCRRRPLSSNVRQRRKHRAALQQSQRLAARAEHPQRGSAANTRSAACQSAFKAVRNGRALMRHPFSSQLWGMGSLQSCQERASPPGLQRGAAGVRCRSASVAVHSLFLRQCPLRAALPNPSFKPSSNGVPRGPGWRYAVHFRHPGPRVTPLVPA